MGRKDEISGPFQDPPEITNPPRNALWGIPADVLREAKKIAAVLAQSSSPFVGPLGTVGELLIGQSPEALDKLSYGERVTTGQGETLHPDPALLDVANFLPTPAKVIPALKGVAAALAAKAPLAAAFGTIRKGGHPELMLHHGTKADPLINPSFGKERTELTAPSMGITFGPFENSFGEEGATIIAREGAFDPVYSPSVIFNRDAYVPRRGAYRIVQQQYDSPTLAEIASARLLDRFEGPAESRRLKSEWGLKFGEGSNYPDSLRFGHQAAIAESPTFRSFAEFEGSPRGAALLADKSTYPIDATDRWSEMVERWYNDRRLPRPKLWEEAKKDLVFFAKGGDSSAQTLLDLAKTFPSDYAEVKVHGQVPLTPEYWAGALGSPSLDSSTTASLAQFFERRGIPFAQQLGQIPALRQAQEWQAQAGAFGRRSMSEDVRTIPRLGLNKKNWADKYFELEKANEPVPASIVVPGKNVPKPVEAFDPSMWGISPEFAEELKKIKASTTGKEAMEMEDLMGMDPAHAMDEVALSDAHPAIQKAVDMMEVGHTFTIPELTDIIGFPAEKVVQVVGTAKIMFPESTFAELTSLQQLHSLLSWAKVYVP